MIARPLLCGPPSTGLIRTPQKSWSLDLAFCQRHRAQKRVPKRPRKGTPPPSAQPARVLPAAGCTFSVGKFTRGTRPGRSSRHKVVSSLLACGSDNEAILVEALKLSTSSSARTLQTSAQMSAAHLFSMRCAASSLSVSRNETIAEEIL